MNTILFRLGILCSAFFLFTLIPSAATAQKLKDKLKDAKAAMGGGSNSDSGGGLVVVGNIGTYDVKTSKSVNVVAGDYNGKSVLTFHEAKGMYKGERILLLERIQKFEQLSTDTVYDNILSVTKIVDKKGERRSFGDASYNGRVAKVAENVYICYNGSIKSSPRGFEKIANYYIKDDENLIVSAVFAPTEEIANEWYNGKALEWAKAFEAKIKAAVEKADQAKLADKRVPAAGKMQSDKSLVAEAEKLLSAKCNRDGTTFKRVVITSNDWTTAKHKNTGAPLYRWVTGYFVDTKAGRNSGECMIFSFNLKQNYDGVGNFAGDYILDCCGQDGNTGAIECANAGK
jgi:hypothetical protein